MCSAESNSPEWIKLSDIVVGGLYYIGARNFWLGIADEDKNFVGRRTKFGDVFTFTEEYRGDDRDNAVGTATPWRLLETSPFSVPIDDAKNEPELLEYLSERKNRFRWLRDSMTLMDIITVPASILSMSQREMATQLQAWQGNEASWHADFTSNPFPIRRSESVGSYAQRLRITMLSMQEAHRGN